jgi:hypothetical protein
MGGLRNIARRTGRTSRPRDDLSGVDTAPDLFSAGGTMIRRIAAALTFTALATLLAACSNNPTGPSSSSLDCGGVVVVGSGSHC